MARQVRRRGLGSPGEIRGQDFLKAVARATVLAALAGLSATPAAAKEPFEGVWARARSDCPDRDVPTSRTFIDLSNRLRGRQTPVFDQYENHCRIDGVRRRGAGHALTMRCFEFYDDYIAQRDGTRRVLSLARRGGNLLIDGQQYRSCSDVPAPGGRH